MANPSKKKGTAGETELLRELQDRLVYTRRTQPGELFDLHRPGGEPRICALATRPDRGEWLVTIDLDAFAWLVAVADTALPPSQLDIEVKRYARFSLHTIFEKKFGGKS